MGVRTGDKYVFSCLAPRPSRPCPFFRVTQANLPRVCFSPFISLPSWQTRLEPPTEDEDD